MPLIQSETQELFLDFSRKSFKCLIKLRKRREKKHKRELTSKSIKVIAMTIPTLMKAIPARTQKKTTRMMERWESMNSMIQMATQAMAWVTEKARRN
jgi:DNA topoisomerase VI subunit B